MASTRVKATSGIQVYHRFAASNDAPQTDVATSDADASGLGSTGDFEIKADSEGSGSDLVTYVDRSGVVEAGSDSQPTAASCVEFLYLENTGFQDAGKTTVASGNLTVSAGAATSGNVTFTLYPGQSILLASPGASADDVNNYYMQSTSGNIYVKMVCAA
tara:strand:+ start:62 stop:541 length:480 start_codon:yes stop_codon:yes gene_type:complete